MAKALAAARHSCAHAQRRRRRPLCSDPLGSTCIGPSLRQPAHRRIRFRFCLWLAFAIGNYCLRCEPLWQHSRVAYILRSSNASQCSNRLRDGCTPCKSLASKPNSKRFYTGCPAMFLRLGRRVRRQRKRQVGKEKHRSAQWH